MKIAFAGTPEVAAWVLKGLAHKHEVVAVITRPDAPLGRRRVMTPSPVAELGLNLEIPVIKTTRVDDRIAQELADSGAELVVVVAYGSLIPKAALDVLPWWNLHFSQLPLWRGAAPVQHSIISGSGQGVSVFELDEGMDTGAVLASVAVELGEECSTGEAMERLSDVGVELLLETLEEMPEPKPQSGEASLAPKITRSQAKLNPNETAVALARKIRAFNPEPMAWVDHGGNPLRIMKAKSLGKVDWSSHSTQNWVAGDLEIADGRVLLVCGEGSRLELLEVQPAGKRAMTAADWARGLVGKKRLG